MKIFDQSVVIKNTGTYDDVDSDKLDMLETMLNQYGVDHAFTLPTDEKIIQYEAKDWEAVVVLAFDSKDADTVLLVYMLWMKYQRNVSHDQLMRAMGRKILQERIDLEELEEV